MKLLVSKRLLNSFIYFLLLDMTINAVTTDIIHGRYGNSSGWGKGGPAFWLEVLASEIEKISNKINN